MATDFGGRISRRHFAAICRGAVAVRTAGLRTLHPLYGLLTKSPSAQNPEIDQNPIRRRGTGLRAIDARRACPGLTLFCPVFGDGTVYLIDPEGNVVHTWKMPYPPGLYGYLTEKRTLFYNGKIPNETFLGKAPFKGGVALEADWNGKVLWEVRHPNHHHDGRLLKNRNVLLLCATELPDDFARKVQGGRPGSEEKGKMWADYLVEMTKDGRTIWEWRTWEHLDPSKDAITAMQDDRSEWTHGNAVIELPDDNLVVSFRNISTIIKIDRQTGEILWKLGAPPLSGQHAPTLLSNGNVLIFDNGPHRMDNSFSFSRVIEVNPARKEIVWKYQEAILPNFYSPRNSNAQRLPNGNTLINEGSFGRFFEVSPEGELVWEYVNPHFGPANARPNAQYNTVFRVYRYTNEEVERARASASSPSLP